MPKIKTTYSTPPREVKLVEVDGKLTWDRERKVSSTPRPKIKPRKERKERKERIPAQHGKLRYPKLLPAMNDPWTAFVAAAYMQNKRIYGTATPDTTRTVGFRDFLELCDFLPDTRRSW